MSFDSMNLTRKVEVAEALFESYSCGIAPPYTLLAEAEDLCLDVEAIKEKVDELYGEDDEEADD